MNRPTAEPTNDAAMADQSGPKWLKTSLRAALKRDPVSVLNGTFALAGILEGRLRNILDLEVPL